MNGSLRIYEKPIPGAQYIAGVDTAAGTGGDSSVIQIARLISLQPIKLKRVATFQDNFIDTHDFADVIYNICQVYNEPYVVVESNAEGNGVIRRLWWDYEYENLVNEGRTAEKLGVRATKKTKPIACLLMKKLIEEDLVDEPDEQTVKQLASFVDEKGKMWGQGGVHDDLVTGLYWMYYALTFDLFEGSMEIRKKVVEEEQGWAILTSSDDSIEEDGEFQW